MTVPLPHASPDLPTYGWTPERKARFLDTLSRHGNARAACRSAGMSAESAYKLRRRDPLFARAWAAAVVLGRDASIQALGERAVEGIEEQIYYRGELVGTRRRYDSRLLLAHLARLDRLADEEEAGEDAGRFDELVACIAAGAEDLSPARLEAIEEAASAACDTLADRQVEDFPALFDPALGDLSEDEEEQIAELDAACHEAAAQAGEEAALAWDSRRAAAFATVDSLCRAASETAGSFPCTLSTVSTAALAAGLAGKAAIDAADPPHFSARTNGEGDRRADRLGGGGV